MKCVRCGNELAQKCNACTGMTSTCFTGNTACFGGRGYYCPICTDDFIVIDETTGEFLIPEGGF
jgi:hypothetical protein